MQLSSGCGTKMYRAVPCLKQPGCSQLLFPPRLPLLDIHLVSSSDVLVPENGVKIRASSPSALQFPAPAKSSAQRSRSSYPRGSDNNCKRLKPLPHWLCSCLVPFAFMQKQSKVHLGMSRFWHSSTDSTVQFPV